MADFVHLHVHTDYSTLDGSCRLTDSNSKNPSEGHSLIGKALRCGMKAVAVTDHGNLFAVVEFHRRATEAGLKPILGYEAYVAPGSRFDRSATSSGDSNHHLTLLAENDRGYRNLIKLASAAYLEGHHYKPRIDKELLSRHSDGLIALSGCLSGEAARAAAAGSRESCRRALEFYRELFGPQRFFVELQENGLEEQARANAVLVEAARELGLRLVATNDCHYLDREDAEVHDILLCIGTGKRRDDPDRIRFGTDAFYFRTAEEMAELFSEFPEALRATVEIAERCDVRLDGGEYHYPQVQVPGGERPELHLRRLVEEGLRARYGEVSGRVRERMETELGVIERMGFVGYMLIVADIMRHAREQGIPVGPGRGSAVGSIVCYALGITKLDPFRYDLLFERFINEGRNEMPDIDLDFCQSRRDEMIQYVSRKYGRDHVAQIITFGTMAAKAAIRDVGRVLDVPLPEVNRLAALVPAAPGMTFRRAYEQEPELARLEREDPVARDVLRFAKRLEGLVRQPGKHAAGVVIADRPVTEYCPLYRQPGTEEVVTQYDMDSVAAIGLLKIDFLGLKTLTMLRRATELVSAREGRAIDPDGLPLDDRATYELFSRGETRGVFQFESDGMRDLLQRARPDRFEDLIALNAMFRPGPMEQIPVFVARKFGKEPVPSIDARVDPLLAETYGIMVYQEQVMRLAQAVAGFSLAEADKLRKAMGKKKPEIMAMFREKFLKGAASRGFPEARAAEIYDLMERFAGYGFNKSHAAAYAFLAYQTAWFKTHYPTEFMAALMTLEMGDTDKIAEYADEARRMGIRLLPPDVNESGVGFTITGERTIRFGLAAVKGVGEKAVESVLSARESGRFASLIDFCERVDLRLVNKGVIESLVMAGAFDSFGAPRARLFEAVPRAIESGARASEDRASGQVNLFGSLAAGAGPRRADEGLPDVPEWPERERLAREKSVLGLYVSGHPLSRHVRLLKRFSTRDSAALARARDGEEVVVGGLLSSVQFRTGRESGKRWARIQLEDLGGTLEARVFERTLDESGRALAADRLVFLCGHVDASGGSPVLLVDEVIPFEEAPQRLASRVTIRLGEQDLDERKLDDLVTVLRGNPGRAEVYFSVARRDGTEVLVRAGDDLKTSPGEQLDSDLEAVLGPPGGSAGPDGERMSVQVAWQRPRNGRPYRNHSVA